ncbi:hypothetical protein [Brevibacillus brevis]|uniref:hypothetical protein n=1 Tax=Brevibacillus brevis TaxID=1393 RepID=UPI0007D8C0C6|nr:hypothetical protein [Brevibacillus brevis]
MKFYNFELKHLFDFLISLELVGKQNRMRTRFCKLIGEQINDIIEQRERLILEFSKKDDNGKPLVETIDESQVKYHLNDIDSFNNELNLLMFEEFVIEESETNRDMLLTVGDILTNLAIPLSGQEAFQYDRYCEAFERLNYTN